jgi:formate hydrogenlyase subunit 6/NADH:ubiquinone oxidoreductase subunit I
VAELILEKGAVVPLVREWMNGWRVVGPRANGPEFVFAVLDDPLALRLDYGTSILSPRAVLQPPQEQIAVFRLGDQPSVRSMVDTEPTVLLGVHTCDVHAMRLLDRVFAGNYMEAHYLERRRKTVIVSIECLQPCDEHCFCKDMGTLSADEGYDLHLTDIGDAYFIHVATQAGESLLEHAAACPATDEHLRRLSEVLGMRWSRFSNRLAFDVTEMPAVLDRAYESALWEELGERCLACGACTAVCPTCFCFDVVDTMALDGREATRVRRWDSCQLDEFARVAGGESFREAQASRQRHRFFHKGKWTQEQFGVPGCVGCGRCARACLAHIDMVECLNAIYRAG